MELWHYSVNEIAEFEPRAWVGNHDHRTGIFPVGVFWFSDDAHGNGWWEFVEGEELNTPSTHPLFKDTDAHKRFDYQWKYPVTIADGARMLTVTYDNLAEFNTRYGIDLFEGKGPIGLDGARLTSVWPDWKHLASDYDGVLFAPWQNPIDRSVADMVEAMKHAKAGDFLAARGAWGTLALDTAWYRQIDCSCGLVFRHDAVTLGEGVRFREAVA